jgi:DNA-binding response OmpR family regulator
MIGPVAGGAVVVVDDDASLRALVAEVLRAGGFEVVEAECGAEALAQAEAAQPALVVLDVSLPGGISGYEVCRALRERFGNEVPVLFLSGERTESFDRVAGLLIGGDDYLTKPFAPDELVARARALLRRTPSPARRLGLTAREHEVLTLLADGRTQKHIADELVISPKTVGAHIERILAKLDVHSRAEAVAMAYRLELIGIPA